MLIVDKFNTQAGVNHRHLFHRVRLALMNIIRTNADAASAQYEGLSNK